MNTGKAFGLALLVFVIGGCSSSGTEPPEPSEVDRDAVFAETFKVGVGDSLSINVWRTPELSMTVPVRPDGRISLPLLGDIEVGGMTPEVIAANIQSDLESFIRDPQVAVIVTSVGSSEFVSRVRVTGAVGRPSSIPFRPGMTIMDVVLDAGGVNDFAAPSRTILYRPGEASIKIDLDAILERGDLSTNYTLRPGDILSIPESVF